MAFGTLLSTGTNSSTATTTSIGTSATLPVVKGDLLFMFYTSRGTANIPTSFTDTLSNTWTTLDAGSPGGATAVGTAWSLVTVAGNTTPTTNFASNSASRIITVGRYAGPFVSSPRDVKGTFLAYATTGALNAPATGTLAQDAEIIITVGCTQVATTFVSMTVNSPFNLDVSQGQSGLASVWGGIASTVVNSPATVTPVWNTTGTPTGVFLNTFSFKQTPQGELVVTNQSIKRAAYW